MKKTVYLSNYCVGFQKYEVLETIIRNYSGCPLGAELATSWTYPEFDQLLEAQAERFRDLPITLHAPFVEVCTPRGSDAERLMQVRFEKAFHWYHLFGATSMVMHTHEGPVPAEKRREMQLRSEEVILKTAEKARQEGIRLTVENVGFPLKHNVLFDQAEFTALFDRLPEDVGALIDTGHAMANGWDIPALVETLGPRIRGYHLHNTDRTHDLHRPIYEEGWSYTPDEMDDLLRCIHRSSPDADLVLEYAPGPHICQALFYSELDRMDRVWAKS